jgi:cyclopropane fatty-acyl-phospholipid synthase-like methyltransferase
MSWRDYWEQDSTVYVNERHKTAHYARLVDDYLKIAGQMDTPLKGMSVLDFGCGEALSADRLAAQVGRLTLSDGSERVRGGLSQRFGALGNVTVRAPEDLAQDDRATFDFIIVNSVLQYVGRDAVGPLLASLGQKLSQNGRMLIGDILSPDLSALTDVRTLLTFAVEKGFLVAALVGLARTAVSDYARTRARHGLTRFEVGDIQALAGGAGLVVSKLDQNVGHNPHRLAFLARRA